MKLFKMQFVPRNKNPHKPKIKCGDEYGEFVKWLCKGKIEEVGEKTVLGLLRPLQIQQGLALHYGGWPRTNRLGLGNSATCWPSFSLCSFRKTSVRKGESSFKQKHISSLKEVSLNPSLVI
jgi:hypothetical protein